MNLLEARIQDHRPVEFDVAAQTGHFGRNIETSAAGRPDCPVHIAEAESRRNGTGDDSLQRIRSGNVAEVYVLKKIARSIGERVDAGPVIVVRDRNALREGASQQIA